MKNGTNGLFSFSGFNFLGAPGRQKSLPVRLSRLASRRLPAAGELKQPLNP